MGAPADLPARALAAHYYTTPEVFDRAMQRLFYGSWQFACHSSQIPQTGDYIAFSIFEQDLFVIRGRDGTVRCFFNVCQHRAHTLVQGTGRTHLVVCPYHAWSYGLDGKLRNANRAKDLPGFDGADICLTEVRLESVCGFLFVNLDRNAPPLAEALPGVEDAIRQHCPDIDDRLFAYEHDLEEACNWLVAVENYNECYHCKGAHQSFATGVVDPKSYDIRPLGAAKCLHHTAKAQSGGEAWYDTSGSDYASFFLWPAFSLQIYPSGLVNSFHWRPLSPGRTRVHRGWYSRDGVVDDQLQKVIDLDRDTTVSEDLVLVENVQRGLASLGYRPGPLVVNPNRGIDSEHSLVKLHEWMREAVDH